VKNHNWKSISSSIHILAEKGYFHRVFKLKINKEADRSRKDGISLFA
jgi:hypothetical protein